MTTPLLGTLAIRPAAVRWRAARQVWSRSEQTIQARIDRERQTILEPGAGDGWNNLKVAMLRGQLIQIRATNSMSTVGILGADLYDLVLANHSDEDDVSQGNRSEVRQWLYDRQKSLASAESTLLELYDSFPFEPRSFQSNRGNQ